jgi:hypothetical protein
MAAYDPYTDPLTCWMDAGEHEPLLRATNAEAVESLRWLLDHHEAKLPDIDSDRLARAGWTLQLAKKWIAPATVITWLKERPNHGRLAIACAVLMVSWNPTGEEPPPDPVLVGELLSVYDRLPYDVISDNSALMVLALATRVALPPQLAARIRGMLERAADDPERPAELRTVFARGLARVR